MEVHQTTETLSLCYQTRQVCDCKSPPYLQELMRELKEELLQEMKGQITAMSKELMGEIRTVLRRASPGPTSANSAPTANIVSQPGPQLQYRPWEGEASDQRNWRSDQYDPLGRPICRQCRQVGHVQRYCPQQVRNGNVNCQPLN